jgi:ABC-type antimicrobial peptide transport system permease subunit
MRKKNILLGSLLLILGLILVITLIGAIIGLPLALIGGFIVFYEIFIFPNK